MSKKRGTVSLVGNRVIYTSRKRNRKQRNRKKLIVGIRFPWEYNKRDLILWAQALQCTPTSLIRRLLTSALGLPPATLMPWACTYAHALKITWSYHSPYYVNVTLSRKQLERLDYYARDRRLSRPKAALELLIHGRM